MERARTMHRVLMPSVAVVVFVAAGCSDFEMPEKIDTGTLECEGGRHDPATGLCWQYPGTVETFYWQDAYNHCDELDIEGHDDWRLPSLDEVTGLLEDCDIDMGSYYGWCASCYQSEVCDTLFDHGPPGDGQAWTAAWTSLPCDQGAGYTWVVNLYNDGAEVFCADGVNSWYTAICVRDEPDDGDGE